MATAGDLINGSLRLIGQLAEGETPSAETANDALDALNGMLASMRNETTLVYQIRSETFTWGAGVESRTIGDGGNFDTDWPVRIADTTFFRDTSITPSVDYPVSIINEAQYRQIVVKPLQVTYPGWIFYDRAYPLGTLRPWPVPSAALELHLSTWTPLSEIASLATEIALPPGYNRMLRFNLACELAPEFGVEPSPRVQKIASQSKIALAQVNDQQDVMSVPGIFGPRWPWGSFWAGGPWP